jgi:hypothetical protein
MAKRQLRRRQERRRQHAEREPRHGWQTRHSLITGAGVTAGAVLGLASPALADNFVVDSNLDNGDGTCATGSCTLRDAINDANGFHFGDQTSKIYFAASLTGQTITLSGSELPLTYATYIYGPGADRLTISGNDDSRIIHIDQKYPGDPVLISGLTLTDGYAFAGAAIYDRDSALTVWDSRLTGNFAGIGGAIAEAGYHNYGRSTQVAYSTIDDNFAYYGGGGIAAQDSFGLIAGSTLDHNTAYLGYGGGASAFGGLLIDSTISGNDAGQYGGGLSSFYAYTYNTILANNIASNLPDIFNYYFLGLYDLVENPDGVTVNGYSDITGVDPQLGGLGNNGGTTPTLKPAAGSPVVDKGFSFLYDDQRGFDRTVDNPVVANAADNPASSIVPDGTDIGSVELSLAEGPQPPAPPATTPPAPPATTPPPAFNLKKAIKKCKKKFAKGPKRKKCIRKAKKRAGLLSARSASGANTTARVAAAAKAWRAEGRDHFGGFRGDFDRDFKGRPDWPDQAWKIKDPTPKR